MICKYVSSISLFLLNVFEVVERNFVFIERSVLKIQFAFAVSYERERVLRYFAATTYSHRNVLTEKVYVYDIERNLIFSVVVRELGKIIFFLGFSCLCCFFHFLTPP